MPKRQRKAYSGCSIETSRGVLALRFRARDGERTVHASRALGLDDTPENRARIAPVAKLVGAALGMGKPLRAIDAILDEAMQDGAELDRAIAGADRGPTLQSYIDRWLLDQVGLKRARSRELRKHLDGYVIPIIGRVYLAELRNSDLRRLQSTLLGRGLSVKYVRNIMSGSLKSVVTQARVDEALNRDPFVGLKWGTWDVPEPDPFTPDEARQITAWFAGSLFGRRPTRGSSGIQRQPHPEFAAYVRLLLTTGMRPSEASGLQWRDVDMARCRLQVRRSWHLGAYGSPKTTRARRTVEIPAASMSDLRTIQPLRVEPDMPVLPNTLGGPIEPNSFLSHWYRCLRSLNLRQRGLYSTKDTFVTLALAVGVRPRWLEQQTGVAYSTLSKHYSRWMQVEQESEVGRLEDAMPDLFDCPSTAGQSPEIPREYGYGRGDSNPHGNPTRS